MTRGRTGRRDEGSALAIALVFLMIFGGFVGVVLQFATTGQRADVMVQDEAVRTYGGGGALDGAITMLRDPLNATVGSSANGTTTCFTMPAGQLGNAADVTVTCTPRTGSGTAAAGTPAQAVLAQSTNASEGLALSGAANVPVTGGVSVNKRVLAPAGTTLTSSGPVQASTCSVLGTVTPTCATPNSTSNPGWSAPSQYPPLADLAAVTCTAPVMKFSPGTYLDLGRLQALLRCPNTVTWFQTGVYYFDFRDTSGPGVSHELAVDAGAVVVGGAAKGWDPTSPTLTQAAVPDPSRGDPTVSACDTTLPGVNFVFGNDSRLNVKGGSTQLCALNTAFFQHHVVVQALGTDATATPGTATLHGTGASSATWTNPTGAMTENDGQSASTTVLAAGASKAINIGPLTDLPVPTDATGITATIRLRETMTATGTGKGQVQLIAYPGGTATASSLGTVRDCTTKVCNGTAGVDSSVTFPGLTAAQISTASVTVTLLNPNVVGDVTDVIDSVTVDLTFNAPVHATSGTAVAMPYVRGSPGTTAVLTASGATTVLALHGTVDVAKGVVDLDLTASPCTIIDRGLSARHVELSAAPAAGFAGPLISVPATISVPRSVLLIASSAGVELGRAELTLQDAAGTANGTLPTLLAWSPG